MRCAHVVGSPMAQAIAYRMSRKRPHGLCKRSMGSAIDDAIQDSWACQTSHGVIPRYGLHVLANKRYAWPVELLK